MKSIVILVLLAVISMASANIFANFHLMMEVQRDKNRVLKALNGQELVLTRDRVIKGFSETYKEIIRRIQDDDDEDEWPNPDAVQCAVQLGEFVLSLQNGELWALTVLDSFAKIQSGIGQGNIRNPGNFRQCIGVSKNFTEDGREPNMPTDFPQFYNITTNFYGKHCVMALRQVVEGEFDWPLGIVTEAPALNIGQFLPSPLFIEFGMCFPAICNQTWVELATRILTFNLGLEPAPFWRNNYDTLCQTADLPPLGWFEIGALILIVLGVVGIVLATAIDMICTQLELTPNTMTIAMSAYTNGRRLFSMRKNKDHVQCLYGIRALALIWLIYGYRHFLFLTLPLTNPLVFVLDFTPGYFSPWVTSFHLAIDAILLLNGAHIAFTFFKKMDRDGRVSIFKMYIYRYVKVTAYVGVLIYLLLTLTPYSSDGPYYRFFTEAQVPACETYFWSAVLHVQNYVNPESICLLHTFLLSIDMQLFWASPLLLFPLFFWGEWVTVLVMLLAGLTVGCAFTVAWFNGYRAFFLSMVVDMDQVFGYLRQIFFATHVRMGAWLIGIFIGYVLFKVSKDKKSPIHWTLETLLWIMSISGIIAVIYWIYPFQQAMVEPDSAIEFIRGDEIQNALYIGFARYIFSLCLAWIIYGCYTGSGYFVNWFFSLSFWMPFARMGLAIYLVSVSAQMVIIASQKTPYVFDRTEIFHAFNGDLAIVLIFSTLVYLMLEAPLMVTLKYINEKISPPPKTPKVTAIPADTDGFHVDIEQPKRSPLISWF